MPPSTSSSLPDRCAVEPTPCDAKVSLSGLALPNAISSCTVFAGRFGRTTSTLGILVRRIDRDEFGRVVFQVVIQQLLDRQRRRRAEQQRVTVGRRTRDVFRADVHGAARHVLDNHRLAPFPAELIGDQPRHDVGGRSGQHRKHDLDDPRRIRFLRGACGARRNGEHQRHDPHSYLQHSDPRIPALARRADATIENSPTGPKAGAGCAARRFDRAVRGSAAVPSTHHQHI